MFIIILTDFTLPHYSNNNNNNNNMNQNSYDTLNNNETQKSLGLLSVNLLFLRNWIVFFCFFFLFFSFHFYFLKRTVIEIYFHEMITKIVSGIFSNYFYCSVRSFVRSFYSFRSVGNSKLMAGIIKKNYEKKTWMRNQVPCFYFHQKKKKNTENKENKITANT